MNHEDLEREFRLYSANITIKETLQEIHKNMEVTDALGRFVTSSFDAIDRLTSVAVKLKNVELEEAILALRKELIQINESLLDVKTENLGFREKNFELEAENKLLKEQIKQLTEKPQTLTLKGKFYYKQDDERPFCPVCYDSTQKISLLTEVPYQEQSIFGYRYRCTACKTTHTA